MATPHPVEITKLFANPAFRPPKCKMRETGLRARTSDNALLGRALPPSAAAGAEEAAGAAAAGAPGRCSASASDRARESARWKEGRNAPRGKPDFFLLSERLGFCRGRERERERELKMMEEKSAAKCTKRFLREGRKD